MAASFKLDKWWSQAGSNRRPPACKAGALPAELWPQCLIFFPVAALRFSRAWSHRYPYAPGARAKRALLQKKSLRTTSTSYSFPALTSYRKIRLRFPLTHFLSHLVQIGLRLWRSVLVHVSRKLRSSWAKWGGKWWVWVDLNHRPHPYQGCALTN